MIYAIRFKVMLLILGVLLPLMMDPARAQEHPAQKLHVVTTNAILADFATQVGGDHIAVSPLLPAGADSHSFTPTPAEIRLVKDADLVIVNGLGLEGWLEKLIQNSGYSGPLIVASEGIEPVDGHAHGSETEAQAHEINPHAWLDVTNSMVYVRNILKALSEHDPDHQNDYESNAQLYLGQLRVLDAWIKRQVATIAPKRRLLITDHDAFAYFAAAYRFDTSSLTGAARLDEPSAREFAELIEMIRNHGGAAIFAETGSSEKVLEELATQAGVQLHGQLDAEGTAIDGCFSYNDMMKNNVRRIVNALEMSAE